MHASEHIGYELGKYAAEAGLPVLPVMISFLFPLAVVGVGLVLVPRLLSALPEPDYRMPLVVISASLAICRISSLIYLRIPEITQPVLLDAFFLSVMAFWLAFKPHPVPTMLLFGYGVIQLLSAILFLVLGEGPWLAKACILGVACLYFGLVAWGMVGLKLGLRAKA